MDENKYGVVWDDDNEFVDTPEDEELVVDEPAGDEEPEEAAPVEPVLDEPAVVYTRGPNGRLIQSN